VRSRAGITGAAILSRQLDHKYHISPPRQPLRFYPRRRRTGYSQIILRYGIKNIGSCWLRLRLRLRSQISTFQWTTHRNQTHDLASQLFAARHLPLDFSPEFLASRPYLRSMLGKLIVLCRLLPFLSTASREETLKHYIYPPQYTAIPHTSFDNVPIYINPGIDTVYLTYDNLISKHINDHLQ